MSPDSRIKRLALGTASIFLLIVGTLLGIPQMYLMAIVVSLIPLVYWVIGLILLRGIVTERNMPSSCQRGERIKVELLIGNSTFFSRFYLRALDRLPRWVRFDGYEDGNSSIILNLQAHKWAKLTYYIRPFRRGRQLIGPTKLNNPDLIGLSTYSRTLDTTTELLVYPEVVPVNPQFFNGGAAHGWMDQENAATRGTGSDFQGVREYRTGDDLRRVNWKTTARTGALAVTEYALGYVSDFAIALDLAPESYGGQDDGFDSLFERAIEVAVSLAVAGLKQGSSVEILTNGILPEINGPLKGMESSVALLTSFAAVNPGSKEPFSKVINRFAVSKTQDRSLIVITGENQPTREIKSSLEVLRESRTGSIPLVFWLAGSSSNMAEAVSNRPGSSEPISLRESFMSSVGRNIIVDMKTDLKGLFSRVLQ